MFTQNANILASNQTIYFSNNSTKTDLQKRGLAYNMYTINPMQAEVSTKQEIFSYFYKWFAEHIFFTETTNNFNYPSDKDQAVSRNSSGIAQDSYIFDFTFGCLLEQLYYSDIEEFYNVLYSTLTIPSLDNYFLDLADMANWYLVENSSTFSKDTSTSKRFRSNIGAFISTSNNNISSTYINALQGLIFLQDTISSNGQKFLTPLDTSKIMNFYATNSASSGLDNNFYKIREYSVKTKENTVEHTFQIENTSTTDIKIYEMCLLNCFSIKGTYKLMDSKYYKLFNNSSPLLEVPYLEIAKKPRLNASIYKESSSIFFSTDDNDKDINAVDSHNQIVDESNKVIRYQNIVDGTNNPTLNVTKNGRTLLVPYIVDRIYNEKAKGSPLFTLTADSVTTIKYTIETSTNGAVEKTYVSTT